MTDSTKATALSLFKARINRIASDTTLDEYFTQRIMAAEGILNGYGIRLTDGSDDLMLLVDLSVDQYQNRDRDGAMPKWLRLKIMERWLRQHKLDQEETEQGDSATDQTGAGDAGGGDDDHGSGDGADENGDATDGTGDTGDGGDGGRGRHLYTRQENQGEGIADLEGRSMATIHKFATIANLNQGIRPGEEQTDGMKTTTEKGFREKIRAACRGVGTYKEEFESMIWRLAELYVRREKTKDEFRESGGSTFIEQTNKGGYTYFVKNPLLSEIDNIDKTILQMERELGLTPKAIKTINDAALGKKPQDENDPLALALGELRLIKTG